MTSGGRFHTDALVRLFGDEFKFVVMPGATEVGIVLRGELIATYSLGRQLYPGDFLTLDTGPRVYKFRCPRWSLKLRLESIA